MASRDSGIFRISPKGNGAESAWRAGIDNLGDEDGSQTDGRSKNGARPFSKHRMNRERLPAELKVRISSSYHAIQKWGSYKEKGRVGKNINSICRREQCSPDGVPP